MVLNTDSVERVPLVGPTTSIHIDADPEEIFEYLSQERHVGRWWFRPGLALDDPQSGGWHFDSNPEILSIDLRWGGRGRWRHVHAAVDRESPRTRVAITAHPVPGCRTGCLEKESIRSSRDLVRLKKEVESRSHLIDSDGYWI